MSRAETEVFCRTCGFAHTQQDEACPRWEAPMFDELTPAENDELWCRLNRGISRSSRRFNDLIGGPHGERMDSVQAMINDLLDQTMALTRARYPEAFTS